MILITGATGNIGRRTAELPLMARDPNKAPTLAGAVVIRGDYGDPQSLSEAFAQVESALVVS